MTVQGLREHRPEVLGDVLARFGREIKAVAYLIVRDSGDGPAHPARVAA